MNKYTHDDDDYDHHHHHHHFDGMRLRLLTAANNGPIFVYEHGEPL
jgi:hypothetical protein